MSETEENQKPAPEPGEAKDGDISQAVVKYPAYRKNERSGAYFKFFNQWKYACVQVIVSDQGNYYLYMQTDSTRENIHFILNITELETCTEQEYNEQLKAFAEYGNEIYKVFNKS